MSKETITSIKEIIALILMIGGMAIWFPIAEFIFG